MQPLLFYSESGIVSLATITKFEHRLIDNGGSIMQTFCEFIWFALTGLQIRFWCICNWTFNPWVLTLNMLLTTIEPYANSLDRRPRQIYLRLLVLQYERVEKCTCPANHLLILHFYRSYIGVESTPTSDMKFNTTKS